MTSKYSEMTKKPIFIGNRKKKIPNAILVGKRNESSYPLAQDAPPPNEEFITFGSSHQQKFDIFRNVCPETKPPPFESTAQGAGMRYQSFGYDNSSSSYTSLWKSNKYELSKGILGRSTADLNKKKTIVDYYEEIKRNAVRSDTNYPSQGSLNLNSSHGSERNTNRNYSRQEPENPISAYRSQGNINRFSAFQDEGSLSKSSETTGDYSMQQEAITSRNSWDNLNSRFGGNTWSSSNPNFESQSRLGAVYPKFSSLSGRDVNLKLADLASGSFSREIETNQDPTFLEKRGRNSSSILSEQRERNSSSILSEQRGRNSSSILSEQRGRNSNSIFSEQRGRNSSSIPSEQRRRNSSSIPSEQRGRNSSPIPSEQRGRNSSSTLSEQRAKNRTSILSEQRERKPNRRERRRNRHGSGKKEGFQNPANVSMRLKPEEAHSQGRRFVDASKNKESEPEKDTVDIRFEIANLIRPATVPVRIFNASSYLKMKLANICKKDEKLPKVTKFSENLILKQYNPTFAEFVDIEGDIEVREGEKIKVVWFDMEDSFDERIPRKAGVSKSTAASREPMLKNKGSLRSTRTEDVSDSPSQDYKGKNVEEDVIDRKELVAKSLATALHDQLKGMTDIDSEKVAEKVLTKMLEKESFLLPLISSEPKNSAPKMPQKYGSNRMSMGDGQNSSRSFNEDLEQRRGFYCETEDDAENTQLIENAIGTTFKRPENKPHKQPTPSVAQSSLNQGLEVTKKETLCPDLLVGRKGKKYSKQDNKQVAEAKQDHQVNAGKKASSANLMASKANTQVLKATDEVLTKSCGLTRKANIKSPQSTKSSSSHSVKASLSPQTSLEEGPTAPKTPKSAEKVKESEKQQGSKKGSETDVKKPVTSVSLKDNNGSSLPNRNRNDSSFKKQNDEALEQKTTEKGTEVGKGKKRKRSEDGIEENEKVFWKKLMNLEAKASFYDPEMNRNYEKHLQYAMQLNEDPMDVLSHRELPCETTFTQHFIQLGNMPYYFYTVFAPALSKREFPCHWKSMVIEQAKRYAAIHVLFALESYAEYAIKSQGPPRKKFTAASNAPLAKKKLAAASSTQLAKKFVGKSNKSLGGKNWHKNIVPFVFRALGERKYRQLEIGLKHGMRVRDAPRIHNVSVKMAIAVRKRILPSA